MQITIHASMTTARQEYGVLDLEKRDRQYGYFQISYHYVITRDGKVHDGRPRSMSSPHGGDIAICLIGGAGKNGTPQDNYTDNQKTALVGLIHNIQKEHDDVMVVSNTPTVEQNLLDSVFNT